MEPRKIVEGVYWVGVNDYTKKLFESLWPLPSGVSYNSYVVAGSRDIAIVDTVDERYTYEYLGLLREVIEDFGKVKYIVVNHLEPDHHGALEKLLKFFPNASIAVSAVGANIIGSLYRVPRDRLIIVRDGDSVDLGGRRLRFIYTPWLHWPETMMTYLEDEEVLFSGDAFGSFGALEGGVFDDEVDIDFYIQEAKRYFANIVSKYSKNVVDAVEKLKKLGLSIKVVAPSHGPVWRRDPQKIIDLYYTWSTGQSAKGVLIVYASMYSRTEKIALQLAEWFRSAGVDTVMHNASETHVSYLLRDLIDARVLVVVYPTYDASVFPYVENFLRLLEVKQLGRGRYAALVEIHAWASSHRAAVDLLTRAGFKLLEPVVSTTGLPDAKALEELGRLKDAVLETLKS